MALLECVRPGFFLLSAAMGAVLIAGTCQAQGKLDKRLPKPSDEGTATHLIPREVLFGNPEKAQPKISPDGKYLSYLAPRDGILNVYVAPINDLAAAKPVTDDKKRGIRAYSWANTSEDILYLQDVGGDEDFHLYAVNVADAKTRDLTPMKKIRAEIQETSHKFPNEILVAINDRDPRYHDIYRIDIKTGDKKLVQKNEGYSGFITDEDFQVRFAQKMSPDGGTEIYKPDDQGSWTKYLKIPQEDSLTTNMVGFDKTGKKVYFIDSRGRNTGALTVLDLETGNQEVIAKSDKADVGSVMLHPTEKNVQAVAITYTRTEWDPRDKEVAADFEKLKKVADGDFGVSSRTLDDRKWIVTYVMDDGPVRYYLYDRDTGKANFLFTNHKALEKQPLRKMHPVVIKSRDNMDLVSYLTLPYGTDKNGTGRPEKPVPMVLLVHGGPWGRDTWGLNTLHQFLANRGYAVLSVNFRGSTGFGKNFINAGNMEWAGKMHDDLIDAVDWAIKEKIAIPDKVAIMGGSYGGYATLVGLTFTPDKFACGVDIVGPSNLVTLLKTIPAYWTPMIELFKSRVGDVSTEAGQEELTKRSPLSRVDKIRRPLLIGQGANDPRVKQAESDQIVSAMKKHNIPVTYVLFPDEGHGFARPENKLAFFAVTEAFLARHLGGQYEPIGTAFNGSSIQVQEGAADIPDLPKGRPSSTTIDQSK